MDDQKLGGPRPGDVEGGLSPVRAFLVLGAVLAAITVWFFATREPTPASPTAQPSRSPDYSLTDAEAIAEFERLNDQLLQAYEERNIALAEEVFTSDSPMLPRVRKELESLLESSVVSRTRFRRISARVVRNSAHEILIERVQVVIPRFETERGRDVTGTRVTERQRSEWVLRLEDAHWLLHNATITRISR